MSSIINNLRAAYQEVQEKLKGDQHKLDHDGDGDIDGKDFAMLRAKKSKGIEAMKKAGNAKADAEADERKKKTNEDTSASADKKPEKYHDQEGRVKTRMVPTKKKKNDKAEGDIDMNPKLDKGGTTEQKESRIRSALKTVLEKKENHSPNKDKAEKPEDALKGQGAKDMMNQPKEIDDTEEKGHDDASKAGRVTKPAKQRNGGDQVRSGDQKIVNPIKKVKEAYQNMKNEETEPVMEISKDMKQRYVKKAVGGHEDDPEEKPNMANLRYGTYLPGKHRNFHNTPNPKSNKDTDREMKNRTKGIERATGSKRVAKSVAKSARRAAKHMGKSMYDAERQGQMDREFNKGKKHLDKATNKAVKAVK